MKPNILALVSFALLAYYAPTLRMEAVNPTPDGGYSDFTTAEGQNALQDLSSGAANTALGAYTLFSTTTTSFNTAVGALALDLNTGDSNTAVGVAALLLNTGTENTAVGVDALGLNTAGGFNAAVGAFALYSNTGSDNTAMGHNALFNNTTGGDNTAVGDSALFSNSGGGANAAIGFDALFGNTSGNNNVSIGTMSLGFNSTGNFNTAVGNDSLGSNSGGSNNTAIGNSAGSNVTAVDNVICIGAGVGGANVSNTCFIGNIHGTTTQNNDALPVLVDSAGQLGTASSSRRYKTDIKPMDKSSESVLALKPVSFRYKAHRDTTPHFGLIAEEVAGVNPNLVVYDADGKPYTVRYDAVNAMLLNEFLKEHRTVQEQGSTIARLEKQVEMLTAGLQKVSAQLEMSKPSPQTVKNSD